jgi:hypothetical protein
LLMLDTLPSLFDVELIPAGSQQIYREIQLRSMVKKRHQQVLQKSLSEVRSEIDRTVSPQMLVVTEELTKYHKDQKVWEERCEVARKHFQDLGLSNLKVILGSMYDSITTLSPHHIAALKASNETVFDKPSSLRRIRASLQSKHPSNFEEKVTERRSNSHR